MDIEMWTLSAIGNKPGQITSGILRGEIKELLPTINQEQHTPKISANTDEYAVVTDKGVRATLADNILIELHLDGLLLGESLFSPSLHRNNR